MNATEASDDAISIRADSNSGRDDRGVDRSAEGRRSRTRRALFIAIGVLYLASVPWYRDTDAPLSIVMGLPDWVAVALCCYIAVAVLNAWAWLLADVPETIVAEESDSRRGRG